MSNFAQLMVTLGADISQFQNAFKQVESEMTGFGDQIEKQMSGVTKDLNSAGNDIASSMDKATTNTNLGFNEISEGASNLESDIAGSMKEITNVTKDAAEEISTSVEGSFKEATASIENGMQETSASIEKSGKEIKENLNESTKGLGDGFEKDNKKARKSITEVGQDLEKSGGQLVKTFGAAGLAITAGLGVAVKSFADFESQMARVGAIAGASKEDLEALSDTALELGAKTSKSAGEVAVGMENLASLGFTANEIMAAMPGIILASEASAADMALTTDVVASTLKSFGMEAKESSRIADILAETANNSAADIAALGETFKYAAPLASGLGVSIEELAAATGIMADIGIKGGQAGTTLRNVFSTLANPTGNAAKELKKLGVQTRDSKNNMLPFTDIMSDLIPKLEGMGSAQKAAAVETIFGQQAVSGMLALIDAGPDKLKEFTGALENSGGAAKVAADKMKDNLAGSMEELGGSIESAMISIGAVLAPLVRKIADGIAMLVEKFNSLTPTQKKFIVYGIAIAGVILTIIGVIGTIMMFIGGLISAFAAIGPAIAAIGAVVMGPIGLVIAIIAALIAIGILVYKNWETIVAWLGAAWEWLKELAVSIFQGIVDFFANWGPAILAVLTGPIGIIWGLFTGKFGAISDFVRGAFDKIKTKVVEIFTNIVSTIKGALDKVKGFFKGLKLQFPKIKLPKFSLEGKFSLSPPSIPKIGVSWHKDGGIFAGPSVVGLGEAGPEAIVPLQGHRMKPFADAISGNIDEKSSQTHFNEGIHVSFDPLDINIKGEGGSALNERKIAEAVEERIVKSIKTDSRRLPSRGSMTGVR